MGGEVRQRVAEVVAAMPPGTLCALIAPPGFGKSAVLDELAAQRARALRVTASEPLDLSAALAADRWVLVDNVDPDRDRPLIDLLAAWAVRGDGRGTVVLSTRSERLRTLLPMSAHAHVMDQVALGLSTDAAVDLLLSVAPGLPASDVSAVVETCQGWPAALQAASRWASSHPGQPVAAWVAGRGSEEIVGRLLADLPSAWLDFLLDTALLDRLSPSLCDHVRARKDSAALLVGLDADLGLVREAEAMDPSDAGAGWWTRHPLLTAALRRMTRGRDLTDVHARAAEWFLAAGDLDATMEHLIGAGRLSEASRVIREHEDALLAHGRASFAHQWYERLGPQEFGPIILHLLRLGWSRALAGDRAGARLAVEQLRSQLALTDARELNDETVYGPDIDVFDLHGQVHLLSAYVAMMAGDAQGTLFESRRACESFGGSYEHTSHQTAPTLLIRSLLWCGDAEGANRELERLAGRPFVTDVIRESLLAGAAALTWAEVGDVYRARAKAESALAWLASQGLDALSLGHFAAPTALAMCQADLGDAHSAVVGLQDVAVAAEACGLVGDQVVALCESARVESTLGRQPAALSALADARRALIATAPDSLLMVRIDAVEAGLRISGGDLVRAHRLVQNLPHGNHRRILSARIALHRRGHSATRILGGIVPSGPREEAAVELVLAADSLGRSTRLAHSHLSRTAVIAHSHGLLTLLRGSPPGLLALAEEVARADVDDRLRELVATAAHAGPGAPVLTGEGGGTATPTQPLSRGELALLPLLPSRDTTERIAQRLGVSVNTVKTRLRRLYRKLGVTSRDEAVAVARARGLVP